LYEKKRIGQIAESINTATSGMKVRGFTWIRPLGSISWHLTVWCPC